MCRQLRPAVLNSGVSHLLVNAHWLCAQGTNLPSLSRALVACGWFGIQTWIGGSSIYQMLTTLNQGMAAAPVIAALGISAPELGCFLLFWAMQVGLVNSSGTSSSHTSVFNGPWCAPKRRSEIFRLGSA